MHKNSLSAYYELSASGAKLSRCQQIIGAILEHGAMTDREAMDALGFADPNTVRPRITELIKCGTLRELENRKDEITGKTVRVVEINCKQESFL